MVHAAEAGAPHSAKDLVTFQATRPRDDRDDDILAWSAARGRTQGRSFQFLGLKSVGCAELSAFEPAL